MKELIKGLREFRTNYVSKHWELLEQLAHGQKPRVLFITCSDSRISPNLLTQTDLGELFVIRNAGNIIPPYGAANGGEGATVEYAIHALGIEQIIICGHSHCGAMKGLLKLNKLQEDMPLVYDWLRHAEATRRLIKENYSGYNDDELLEIAIAENVLTQIENLKTYPVIHSRIYQGKLKIYAWVYHIETGEVLAYDPDTHSYIPPQTQLEFVGDDGYAASRVVSTSAPSVACELPPQMEEIPATVGGRSGISAGKPVIIPRSSTPAPQRTTSQPSQPPHQEDDYLSMPWLTPEQADRIYRGSANRR